MENRNSLDAFTLYIEDLCRRHTSINHTADEKHFVRLNSEELPQEQHTIIKYPVVTMDKITATYTGAVDAEHKSRNIELMFLDWVTDPGDSNRIEAVFANMEEIAEDFLRRMKTDRRNKAYPFLKNFTISAELDYVEAVSTLFYGVLLSFDFDAPFDNCIKDGRFR